jgi:hypothetical protein
MSFKGINLSRIERAMEKGGMHLACVLDIHDFNHRGICRKCGKLRIERKKGCR